MRSRPGRAPSRRCAATNLPPHPKPPAGSEPAMQVEVPSERLTAQWNLGAWHLLRHCGRRTRRTGGCGSTTIPTASSAAETYMVLAALDLMGSHKAAEDGFDQWVSLPMDPNSKRPSPLGASRPSQRAFLGRPRMPDARRGSGRRAAATWTAFMPSARAPSAGP